MSVQPQTSIEALHSTPERKRTTLRKRILDLFQKAGPRGLTGYEVKIAMGAATRHSTIYPRLLELEQEEYAIKDSGRTRATDTGRKARVFVLNDTPPTKAEQIRLRLKKLYREQERLSERIFQAEKELRNAEAEEKPQKELFL